MSDKSALDQDLETNCPSVSELRGLLESSLDDKRRKFVAGHVEVCHVCQTQLDALTGNGPVTENRCPDEQFSNVLSGVIESLKNSNVSHLSSEKTRSWPAPIIFPGSATAEAPLGAVGRYEVRKHIATGGSGVLFEAWDGELHRMVALKVLPDAGDPTSDAYARLMREARALVNLRHPHIVQVYDVLDYDDLPPIIVMEYLEGGTLGELLDQCQLSPMNAAKLVMQAAEGLHVAHASGLVHRDIKPSNVLLRRNADGSSEVCVADFGLVCLDGDETRLTKTGELAGTPIYMSPEQTGDPSGVDCRTDVYSLGCVLYELLTGNPPFTGTVRMVLWQVVNDTPRGPRTLDDRIPKAIELICLKAMMKRPDDRYQSALSLADDLGRYIAGSTVTARPPGLYRRCISLTQRYPIAASTLFAALFAAFSVATVSVAWALQLNKAQGDLRVQAARAAHGRDIATNVMESIVFDAYDALDQDSFDVDELQIMLLRAAARGLAHIDDAGDPQTRLDRAETHSRLGRALWRIAQPEEALTELRRAHDLISRLPSQEQNLLAVRRLNLQILYSHIAIYEETDRIDQLNATLAKAINMSNQLLAEHGDDPVVLQESSQIYLASAYATAEGEDERFLGALEKSLAIHQRLGDVARLAFSLRIERLDLFEVVAGGLLDLDRPGQASTAYQTLATVCHRLQNVEDEEWDEFGTSEYLDREIVGYAGMAACEMSLQRYAQSLELSEKAWSLCQEQLSAVPTGIIASDTVWMVVSDALDTAELGALPDAAIEWARRAVILADMQAEQGPDDPELVMQQLSTRRKLAKLLAASARREEANHVRSEIRQIEARRP